MKLQSPRYFTLVELLVVLGVLVILSSIALLNLLDAQVRAKTSRVAADMHSFRMAVEAYAVDSGRVPRMSWENPPYNDRYTGNGVTAEGYSGCFGYWITTPIAYVSRFDQLDPFVGALQSIHIEQRLYTYHDYPTLALVGTRPVPSPAGGAVPLSEVFRNQMGHYTMMSLGPDLTSASQTEFWIQYDPTNGIVSTGNIWRSQKHWDLVEYDFSEAYE